MIRVGSTGRRAHYILTRAFHSNHNGHLCWYITSRAFHKIRVSTIKLANGELEDSNIDLVRCDGYWIYHVVSIDIGWCHQGFGKEDYWTCFHTTTLSSEQLLDSRFVNKYLTLKRKKVYQVADNGNTMSHMCSFGKGDVDSPQSNEMW